MPPHAHEESGLRIFPLRSDAWLAFVLWAGFPTRPEENLLVIVPLEYSRLEYAASDVRWQIPSRFVPYFSAFCATIPKDGGSAITREGLRVELRLVSLLLKSVRLS